MFLVKTHPLIKLLLFLSLSLCESIFANEKNADIFCQKVLATEKNEAIQKIEQAKSSSQVVFFASWCMSCKDSLIKNANKSQAIAVVWNDKKENAENALKFLKWSGTCYFDEAGLLRDFYKISSLPGKLEPS